MKENLTTLNERAKISVNIPTRLLTELDEHRNSINQDRSHWITSAIMEKIANIKKKEKMELNL